MFGIGAGELIVILIAGLVIFGPGKLPEVGRALGKGLREFRKAQAAFTATLDEVSAESVKKSAEEKISDDKKVSLEKNPPAEKKPADEKSAVSVDDVIDMAKNNPFAKENVNEKIFDSNVTVPADTSIGKRAEPAGGSGYGAEK